MRKRLCLFVVLVLIVAVMMAACSQAESIICGNCSTANPKNNQFCASCGTAFFQNGTQNPTDGTQATTPAENTEPTDGSTPTNTEPAPTQPTPTQPTPTQPSHTHSYSAATCTAPKTCSCGATTGSALGHNWDNATCTSPKKCSHCGTTSGSATGHSYTSKIIEPTCKENGYVTYTCSVCGDTYKDNYKDTSHNYHNYVCTACGTVDKKYAFEYLTIWIYKNGNDNGNDISVDYTSGQSTFSLSWNPTYSLTSISIAFNSNGETFVSLIDLKDYVYCTILGDTVAEGQINPATFTKSTSLTTTTYRGDATSKNEFLDVAQISVCDLLDWFEWFLVEYDIGITIADLGFTAY